MRQEDDLWGERCAFSGHTLSAGLGAVHFNHHVVVHWVGFVGMYCRGGPKPFQNLLARLPHHDCAGHVDVRGPCVVGNPGDLKVVNVWVSRCRCLTFLDPVSLDAS
jgi:hypothetical protein